MSAYRGRPEVIGGGQNDAIERVAALFQSEDLPKG
jgi:hypothetical protein